MEIVFFSNFLNHHQLPLCMEFVNSNSVDFTFVATEETPKERLDMNYLDMNNAYEFVLRAYESDGAEEQAYQLAEHAEVVIFGAVPLSYIETRMNTGKITFRFCERALKKGVWRRFVPHTYRRIYKEYVRYKKKELYILAASGYAANDLRLCGFDSKKCYCWGYFPHTKKYHDIDSVISRKDKNTILWVARLIELKHPEMAIAIAKQLNKDNVSFKLKLIGSGKLRDQIWKMVRKEKLEAHVEITGALEIEQVRREMENAGIFLFTSDFNEGWGAVVNEAMNSACALVVSRACGAAPFLIRHKQNGFIFQNGNFSEAYEMVLTLLKNPNLQEQYGRNAYLTIQEEWNAQVAVTRLVKLIDNIRKKECVNLYKDGPCSQSKLYKNNGTMEK